MNRQPVEADPVGEHLLEELEARGWTQVEFAEILGRPPQVISEIISGKKEITRESAAQISAALGTNAEYWLAYQDRYHLWKQSQDNAVSKQLDDVRLRARLVELAPLALLQKRGVITAPTLEGQARELCDLLKITSIQETPRLPMAARRSNTAAVPSSTQIAWWACVQRLAENMPVSTYSPGRLSTLAARLSRHLSTPERFADLPSLFAEVGVRLVHVEAFPTSKIDGATFSIDGSPVIGLSGRGQRLDKVLFTLLHEVAHIVLDHIADEVILDEADAHNSEREQQADDLASAWAIPGHLPAPPQRIGQAWIASVAESLGVHPIVITGRLQKKGVLSWRSALVRDAPTVTNYLRSW